MQIKRNTVVTIDYTLHDDDGSLIESSEGRDPYSYIHGIGATIPGLEAALEGKETGEELTVSLPPEQAYGERDEQLVQVVPRERFKFGGELTTGMQFHASTEDGKRVVTVTKVDGGEVTVDGNHPLAGTTLTFAVTVREVREASAEELEHGHIHGPGAHGHDE